MHLRLILRLPTPPIGRLLVDLVLAPETPLSEAAPILNPPWLSPLSHGLSRSVRMQIRDLVLSLSLRYEAPRSNSDGESVLADALQVGPGHSVAQAFWVEYLESSVVVQQAGVGFPSSPL
ncbi:hypothetical protein Cni_G21385 [Canna indica]|uniref:Uncharacterized protein n=1 Tax=Canna indica TaxID=4628 RepID=A0AAQ3KPE5_9LILI|nr:hypothetical protein Cni_G21385 [Canna indica]